MSELSMSWVRFDDQFFDHPKIVEVGPAAAWLFACSVGYASRHLTDGFVPSGVIDRLAFLKGVPKLVSSLVSVGLWEPVEGGYQIHDYLVYQPSAEQVRAQRQSNAARQESWRQRRNGVSNAPRNAVTNGPNNGPVTPAPIPVPIPAKELHPEYIQPDAAERGVGENQGAAAPPAPPPDGHELDKFNQALIGLPGYEPSAEFLGKVGQKYGDLDIHEEALKIAGWFRSGKHRRGKKEPQLCSQLFVLNWLKRATEPSRKESANGAATKPAELGDPYAAFRKFG